MAEKSAKTSRNHLSHQKIFCYLPLLPAMAAAIAAGRGRREIVSPAILIYAAQPIQRTSVIHQQSLKCLKNLLASLYTETCRAKNCSAAASLLSSCSRCITVKLPPPSLHHRRTAAAALPSSHRCCHIAVEMPQLHPIPSSV